MHFDWFVVSGREGCPWSEWVCVEGVLYKHAAVVVVL